MAKEIKTIKVCAKTSDSCCFTYVDKDDKEVGFLEDSYVPDYFPEEHYGDYLELEIDVKTGRIINWVPPSQETLRKTLNKN